LALKSENGFQKAAACGVPAHTERKQKEKPVIEKGESLTYHADMAAAIQNSLRYIK
jgi:hypothetical protein